MIEEQFARRFVSRAYVPYIFHVIANAKSRNIKTLYFVSRDAFVLQKIAEMIPHDGIEYKYLFVSRKSLEGAFYHIASDDIINKIGLKGQRNIGQDYSNEYKLAIGYLRQEGVFDDNIALVDIGWYGRTRVMINLLRKNADKGNILSYYFGFHSTVLSEEYGPYDSYLIEPIKADWTTYVIEEFYSACPYGSTMGYKLTNGHFYPVFRTGEEYNETRLVKANVDTCIKYAEDVLKHTITSDELYSRCIESIHLLFDTDFIFSERKYIVLFNSHELTIKKLSAKELYDYIRCRELSYKINIPASLRFTLGIKGRLLAKTMRLSYQTVRGKWHFYTKQG